MIQRIAIFVFFLLFHVLSFSNIYYWLSLIHHLANVHVHHSLISNLTSVSSPTPVAITLEIIDVSRAKPARVTVDQVLAWWFISNLWSSTTDFIRYSGYDTFLSCFKVGMAFHCTYSFIGQHAKFGEQFLIVISRSFFNKSSLLIDKRKKR